MAKPCLLCSWLTSPGVFFIIFIFVFHSFIIVFIREGDLNVFFFSLPFFIEIHSLLEVMTENDICKAVWDEKRKTEPGFYGDFLLVNEQQRISLLVSL